MWMKGNCFLIPSLMCPISVFVFVFIFFFLQWHAETFLLCSWISTKAFSFMSDSLDCCSLVGGGKIIEDSCFALLISSQKCFKEDFCELKFYSLAQSNSQSIIFYC